ncbi:AlpA family transcriptional regulator [uncultured Methylophaga sp.]|uniref:helix-turn-helix transcriptional regulator n=1 Tax=uncultured Methylophaga sp. TaxID=285271 RepID=UPI00261CA7EE|nr:AlpA family transcriptional regulator [uncultured Methylophaga sp.]
MSEQILKLPDVIKITGLARSTVYKLINENRFPKQIKLTSFSSGWLQSEISQWIDERIAASRRLEK